MTEDKKNKQYLINPIFRSIGAMEGLGAGVYANAEMRRKEINDESVSKENKPANKKSFYNFKILLRNLIFFYPIADIRSDAEIPIEYGKKQIGVDHA